MSETNSATEEIVEGTKRRSFFRWYGRIFKNGNKIIKLLLIAAPLLLVYELIVGRGWYQPALVYVRVYWPILLFAGLIIWLFYLGFRKAQKWYGKAMWFVFFAGFVTFSVGFGEDIYTYVAGYYVYHNRVTVIELDHPPESIHPKLQPQFVVESYFKETMNNNRQPTMPRTWVNPLNNEQYWTGWTEPGNYIGQKLNGKVEEFIRTNVQNPAPVLDDKEREMVDFQVGSNLLFSHNIQKAARKKLGLLQMWNCEVSDMVVGMRDDKGNLYQVVPVLEWDGFLFPRPVFGGVFIFDDTKTPYAELVFAGKGEFLSAEEVQASPWLHQQALLDDRTVNFFGKSLRFKYGFKSGLPGNHENDHRIPNMERRFSSLPVIEQFDFKRTNAPQAGQGLFYWLELEPYDSTKFGLSMDVFVPGTSTDTIYVIDRVGRLDRSGYRGMSVAADKIMEDDKSYNWIGREGGTFIPGGERPYYTYVFPEDTIPEMFYLANVLTVKGQNQESTSTKAELYLIHAKFDDIIVLLKNDNVYPENWKPLIQERMSTQRRLMRRDGMDHGNPDEEKIPPIDSAPEETLQENIISPSDSAIIESLKRENEELRKQMAPAQPDSLKVEETIEGGEG